MKSRSLYIAMLAFLIAGCASLTTSSKVRPQANLRQQCPDLPQLDDGTRATVLKWITYTIKEYQECQSRVKRLVEAVDEKDAGEDR